MKRVMGTSTDHVKNSKWLSEACCVEGHCKDIQVIGDGGGVK